MPTRPSAAPLISVAVEQPRRAAHVSRDERVPREAELVDRFLNAGARAERMQAV